MANHDAGYEAREAARLKYKPERIKWLLIAEAPPASLDRFFYFERVREKDYLYIETMKVLFPITPEADLRARKGQFLQWFKENGFYLIDALDNPIAGDTRSRERREKIWGNRGSVLRKLEQLRTSVTNETKIILIKASVYELDGFLRRAEYDVANTSMIPFPSTGHQAEYREEMARILRSPARSYESAEATEDDAGLALEDVSQPPGKLFPAKLLLDEYCSTFSGDLKDAGWEVKTVHDFSLANKKPQEVAAFARANDAILVVRDRRIEQAAQDRGARCLNISTVLITGIVVTISGMADQNGEETSMSPSDRR